MRIEERQIFYLIENLDRGSRITENPMHNPPERIISATINPYKGGKLYLRGFKRLEFDQIQGITRVYGLNKEGEKRPIGLSFDTHLQLAAIPIALAELLRNGAISSEEAVSLCKEMSDDEVNRIAGICPKKPMIQRFFEFINRW